MICLTDVEKSFRTAAILRGVSFQIDSGERVSLIGAGGCGKTTLLKLVLGLLTPDAGQIEVMQVQARNDASDPEWRQVLKKIGMAFQQGGLFDFMTVEQNLLFAMHRMTDFGRQEMEERITFLLDKVKLQRARTMFPYQLSGGMQRRVGIARALSIAPTIAIFDEPTAGLDPVTSTIILNMILELRADPKSILLVATTNVETAIRFAKRIIVINDGLVVADGDWQQLLLDGPQWVQHFLRVRLIGIGIESANQLRLPKKFIDQYVRCNNG